MPDDPKPTDSTTDPTPPAKAEAKPPAAKPDPTPDPRVAELEAQLAKARKDNAKLKGEAAERRTTAKTLEEQVAEMGARLTASEWERQVVELAANTGLEPDRAMVILKGSDLGPGADRTDMEQTLGEWKPAPTNTPPKAEGEARPADTVPPTNGIPTQPGADKGAELYSADELVTLARDPDWADKGQFGTADGDDKFIASFNKLMASELNQRKVLTVT